MRKASVDVSDVMLTKLLKWRIAEVAKLPYRSGREMDKSANRQTPSRKGILSHPTMKRCWKRRYAEADVASIPHLNLPAEYGGVAIKPSGPGAKSDDRPH